MKKFIATSVLASAILFPTLANAENMSFPVKMTTEMKVDIRKGATTSYSIIKTLNTDQQVTVIDEFTNSAGEKWYHVDLGNAKGWGISKLFSRSGSTSMSNTTINSSNVSIRKGATSSYPIIGTLQKGNKVKVIDSFINNQKQLWYRIESKDKTGWIPGNFLTLPQAQQTSTNQKTVINSSPIRKGATTSYPSIGTLTKNQKVNIMDTFTNAKNEKWFRIKSGNLVGWVISTTFEAISTGNEKSPVPAAPAPETVKKTLFVKTNNTNLYSGANYNYKLIEKIPFNSKVQVLDEFINPSKQTWVRIKTVSGKTGWTPKYELFSSNGDLQYVFAYNKAEVRRGASAKYAITNTLNVNDRLLVLYEAGDWLNVETASGKRGWIIKKQTSQVTLKGLISPSTYTEADNSYLVWQKSMDFNLSYSVLASNKLKLSNEIPDVVLPSFKVKGIKSIEALQTGASNKSIILTFEPGYTFTIRNYEDKVTIKVLPTGLLGKKIVVDAGHGGKDTGALGPNGLKEKDANLGTALLLKNELEKAGAFVTLTRGTDIFLELSERTDVANLSDADAFISIHSDSFTSTSIGTTTYFNTSVNFNGPRSRNLAQHIQQNMISTLKTYNRGVKEQDFYVNRMNELPSILVELAFISNPKEEALLRSNDFRQKAAIGITKGLEEYYQSF